MCGDKVTQRQHTEKTAVESHRPRASVRRGQPLEAFCWSRHFWSTQRGGEVVGPGSGYGSVK